MAASSTIMGALGGIPLPGEVPKKKFSFVLLLGGNEKGQFRENIVGGFPALAACQPSIVFNPVPAVTGMRVTDSAGAVFSGSATPTFTQANCTFNDGNDFKLISMLNCSLLHPSSVFSGF